VGGLAAFVAFSSLAYGAGVPVDQASKAQWKAAQKTFRVGDELYDDKRYAEALTAYRASHEIVASPNSRLMMGRCLRELGRLNEAYAEFEAALSDAEAAAAKEEKYRDTARASREDLEALKLRVALLTLSVTNAAEGTKLSVAGKDVPLDSLEKPLVLAPGSVEIVATAPDRPELRRKLQLEAGSASTLELDLSSGETRKKAAPPPPPPAPPPPPSEKLEVKSSQVPLRTWAYVAGGVGAAGFVTFGVFGLLNNSKFSDLEGDCPADHCSPDRADDIDSGRRYQTIANVGLIVGAVGVGTGAVLFLMSGGRSEEQTARAGPWVSLGPGQIRAGGSF
jgi:hypothetical protein